MASTRAATGHSKPRVVPTVSTTPERKRKTTTARKPATKTATKKSATGAGVKKRAPATHHKRKASVKDKVEGALEKVEGSVTRKPGKKAAGTKKIRGTDGKNARTAKKA